jgi:hypothetical protein
MTTLLKAAVFFLLVVFNALNSQFFILIRGPIFGEYYTI